MEMGCSIFSSEYPEIFIEISISVKSGVLNDQILWKFYENFVEILTILSWYFDWEIYLMYY